MPTVDLPLHQVFLDSDDLKDLSQLQQHVRHSDVFVLLQTKHVLERPWCAHPLSARLDVQRLAL